MLPTSGGSSGGGNLGSARGRIVIDVTSVEAAVAATKKAAQEISANLARVNQSAQRTAAVDAKRAEREAKAQIDAAKLAADIRSKSAASAAANVVASLNKEAKAAEDTAERVVAAAKRAQGEAARTRSGLLGARAEEIAIIAGFMKQLEAIQKAEVARLKTIRDQNTALQQQIAEAERVRMSRESSGSFVGQLRGAVMGGGAPLGGTALTRYNLANLQEIPFHQRMPTFAQFQLYPFMQLFQVIGATDAANVTALSMGLLGLSDTARTFVPTMIELGRGFGQSQGIIGRYTRAVVGMIPGLSGAAAGFVALGAVLAPVAVATIAIAGALKIFSDAAERGRKAAEDTARAIDGETQRRQSLLQQIGQATGSDIGVRQAELMGQAVLAQQGIGRYRTDIASLEQQLGIPAGFRGDILRSLVDPRIAELKAQLDATYESMETAQVALADISAELALMQTTGVQAAAVLDRINRPLRETALRREFSGMDSGALSQEIRTRTTDLALLRQKEIDLSNEYTLALNAGQTVLAAVLLTQKALNQVRLQEAEEARRIAIQALPLVRAREQIASVVQVITQAAQALQRQQISNLLASVDRSQVVARLLRSGDAIQIREMITARQDEAAAIAAHLPALMAAAPHSSNAREQLAAFIQRLGLIAQDIAAFNNALPVAETRAKLTALTDMLRETLPNLFPQSAVERLRGQIEHVKGVFRDYITNAIDAADARVSREQEFAGLARNATPESIGERIQALQDERDALDAGIASLRLTAVVSEEARAKMAEMRAQQQQVGADIERLITETLPAAVARAQGELISQINAIEQARDAAIRQVEADLLQREKDIETERGEALAELDADIAKEREKAAVKHGEALAKVEDDLAKAREKILRRFAVDSQNAIANRDALAYHMAKQRRDEDLANLKEQGEERKKELDKQYKDQNKAIDDRLKEQQAAINKRYDNQLRAARTAAERAIQMERDRATAEIAARRNAYQAQFNDLRAALFDEYALKYQAARATVGLAEWTAREVNRILGGVSGQQIVIPNYVQAPQTGSAYENFVNYQRSQGVPGFAVGTNYVPATGLYLLHGREGVINPETNDIVRRMLGSNYTQPQLAAAVLRGATGGSTAQGINIPITINGGGKTARQIADIVDRQLYAVLREAGIE